MPWAVLAWALGGALVGGIALILLLTLRSGDAKLDGATAAADVSAPLRCGEVPGTNLMAWIARGPSRCDEAIRVLAVAAARPAAEMTDVDNFACLQSENARDLALGRWVCMRPRASFAPCAVVAALPEGRRADGLLTDLKPPPPGCSGGDDSSPLPLVGLDASAMRGAELFVREGCASCHLVAGVGAPGPGPELTRIGTQNRSTAILRRWLVSPDAPMPSFAALPPADLDDLAYLMSGLGTRYR